MTWSLQVSYVCREVNLAGDWMASHAVNTLESSVWHDVPNHDLAFLVQSHAMGCNYAGMK